MRNTTFLLLLAAALPLALSACGDSSGAKDSGSDVARPPDGARDGLQPTPDTAGPGVEVGGERPPDGGSDAAASDPRPDVVAGDGGTPPGDGGTDAPGDRPAADGAPADQPAADGGTDQASGPDASDAPPAGDGSAGSCFPSCLADLQRPCVPMGTCMFQASPTGINTCYSNGVKMLTMLTGASMATTRFTREDGASTCYTVDSNVDAQGNASYVYKTAGGATAATVTSESGSTVWTIMCGGMTYTVDTASPACQSGSGTDGGMCTMGTCS